MVSEAAIGLSNVEDRVQSEAEVDLENLDDINWSKTEVALASFDLQLPTPVGR